MSGMPRAVGRNRAEHFFQSCPFLCPGGAGERGSLARAGRVPVRRRTRRFGHFALKPGKVFAPRCPTRRQCRVGLGWHRAACQAKQGESAALLCCAALPAPFFARISPACPGFAPLTSGVPFARRGQKRVKSAFFVIFPPLSIVFVFDKIKTTPVPRFFRGRRPTEIGRASCRERV